MKDRIRQLMESQHMTQQTFSDFIGISSASLSSIFTGRTKPTLYTVEAIRSKFTKISLDWLMYGSGPMFKDGDSSSPTDPVMNDSTSSEGIIDFDNAPSDVQTGPYTTKSPQPLRRTSLPQNPQQGGYSTAANPSRYDVKYIDKPQRHITEIRIFFDDQTWETFVPKK